MWTVYECSIHGLIAVCKYFITFSFVPFRAVELFIKYMFRYIYRDLVGKICSPLSQYRQFNLFVFFCLYIFYIQSYRVFVVLLRQKSKSIFKFGITLILFNCLQVHLNSYIDEDLLLILFRFISLYSHLLSRVSLHLVSRVFVSFSFHLLP